VTHSDLAQTASLSQVSNYFNEQGFYVFRNAIGEDELRRLRDEVVASARNNEKKLVSPDAVYNFPTLEEWVVAPPLTRLADACVAGQVKFLQCADLHLNHNVDGWHRDSASRRVGASDWQEDKARYTCLKLISYVDCSDFGLEVIPGSHRFEISRDTLRKEVREPQYLARTEPLPSLENRAEDYKPLVVEVAPGDVLVFDLRLLHRGHPKKKSRPERFADNKSTISFCYGLDNFHSQRFHAYFRYHRRDAHYCAPRESLTTRLKESKRLLSTWSVNFFDLEPQAAEGLFVSRKLREMREEEKKERARHERKKRRKSVRRLNVGPGKDWAKEKWHTLDFYSQADVMHDLRDATRLPLPYLSVEKIYCSHVIEHIDDRAARMFFQECHRVLKYGGRLRLACPNAEKAIENYQKHGDADPDNEVVSRAARSAAPHLRLMNVFASFKAPTYKGHTNTREGTYTGGPICEASEVETKLQQLDPIAFGKWCAEKIPGDATYFGHVNCYTPERLIKMLKLAGFGTVTISQYRGSPDPELRTSLFDNRPGISLFVEARADGRRKRASHYLRLLKQRARNFRRKILG